MDLTTRVRPWGRIGIITGLILLALMLALYFTVSSLFSSHAAGVGAAATPLTQISSDPYHNNASQHQTEVEPDTFAFGNTIVSAFQVGRFWNGGGSNIGFATSTDGGKTFIHGFMPGLTVFSSPPGPYPRASDASVAFDAKHNVWLVSSLGLHTTSTVPSSPTTVDVVVNRSIDGGKTFQSAIPIAAHSTFYDKNWTACDDTPSSPFYGNCYTEFDNNGDGDRILMSTSTDGGLTWGPPLQTANHDFGLGGQPVVQPSGRVIVPIVGFYFSANQGFNQKSFISTDGGKTWSATVIISLAPIKVPQGIRDTIPLPSAEVDASGTVYSTWQDCRFEPGCNENDLVLSTTTDGLHWTAPKRIPIDSVNSHFDHFAPGLGVDRTTSGSSAHLALTFYYFGLKPFSTGNCQTATCLLFVGYIDSTDGGKTWSAKKTLAGPMLLQWLALTTQGYMVGDYISTSIIPSNHLAYPAFEIATPPTGHPVKGFTCISTGVVCHESTFTEALTVKGGTNPLGNGPVYGTTGQSPRPVKPDAR